jgi:hypothetical protein
MRVTAPLVIGALCLTVATLTVTMAAPSRRAVATVVVGLPLVLAALFAYRKHRELLKLLAFQAAASTREEPLAAALPDPHSFITMAPHLAAEFQHWARTHSNTPLATAEDFENFAVRHGGAIPVDGPLFLQWVAAYGESIRSTTNGRWVVGRLLARGEPLVASGRFPFLRHRVLLAATQVLETAEDLKWQ